MADTFADFIGKERERLNKLREDVFTRQQALDQELAGINKELAAITAYEAVKTGKAIPTEAKAPRAPRQASSGSRAPRGSVQQTVLETVQKHTDGITRGALLEAMGMKGNKSGEQSVSNALSALKKAKKIGSKDGKYMPA